jgi:hypothetical protein
MDAEEAFLQALHNACLIIIARVPKLCLRIAQRGGLEWPRRRIGHCRCSGGRARRPERWQARHNGVKEGASL